MKNLAIAEEFQQLRKVPIFSAWPEPLLLDLWSRCRKRNITAKETLFVEGSQAYAFYLLLSGGVHLISESTQGNEKIVEIMQAGDLFAEAVAFLGGRYPVMARAEENSEVLEIPLAPFLQQLEERPQLMRQMLARLSMRLHFLVKELRQMSVENADERVLRFLLEVSAREQGSIQFTLPAKKRSIATRLGLAPETFSRVLRKLQDRNLLTIQGKTVIIPDLSKLRAALLK